MFSNLRIGAPLYVLHKNEPRIEEGEVQSVGIPTPQFNMSYVGGAIQPQKMTVDLKVKVGEQIIELQKLPADQTIADFGTNGMVISESREAILNEVEIMRKNSQAVLDSVEHHREVLQKTQQLIEQLDPGARQDAKQREEIESLKQNMEDIKGMLSKLLGSKSKKEE